jgi:hypothetical protein
MKLEEPCSPGHCLGMLNANMRTDILRHVHGGIEKRKDKPPRKSPLVMIIDSIEDVLELFQDESLFLTTVPNPFNSDPKYYRFEQEADSQHDVQLLNSQLGSLREILASLSDSL